MSSNDHMPRDPARYMGAPFGMSGGSSAYAYDDRYDEHPWIRPAFRIVLVLTPVLVWSLTRTLTPDVVLRALADENRNAALLGTAALGLALTIMVTMIMDVSRMDHVNGNRALGITSIAILSWMFAVPVLGLSDDTFNPYIRAKAPTSEQMSMLSRMVHIAPEVRSIIDERIVGGRLDRGAAHDILDGEPLREAMRRVDERQAEYHRAVVLGR